MGTRGGHRRREGHHKVDIAAVEGQIDRIASDRMKDDTREERRQRPPDDSQIEGRQRLEKLLEPVFPLVEEVGVKKKEVLDAFTVTGRRANRVAGLFQDILGDKPETQELSCASGVVIILTRVNRIVEGDPATFNALVNLMEPKITGNRGKPDLMIKELAPLITVVSRPSTKGKLRMRLGELRHGKG